MRLLAAAVVLFAGAAMAAITYPALTGRIVDDANILSEATREAIEPKLVDLENKSGIQLVVATVPSLQDNDIETFANGLFRTWKLGEAKKNNGALLLVAPNERKVRIEVGYGLEGVVTDALSSVIIQSAMLPRFKVGDFSGGVDRGVDALISAMSSDQSEWQKKARVRHDDSEDTIDQLMPFFIFLLFLFIVIMMSRNAQRSRGRGGPIFFPTSTGGSWGSGSGGGWSSGGGGFSDGGGFSGGGGSSGGGGASGSW